MIKQSSYAELLKQLMEELFFVTEDIDLVLCIFLTTGKNRRTMINKRGFCIMIFSFLYAFYVCPEFNRPSTHLSNSIEKDSFSLLTFT